ncbi:unnamed protein product [Polarella glacialis]|uniref:PPPDE domain-containing protein n=1 Tax=Polarella glacialis TaxID=89957 RepID=A0A813JJR8_POLGL|nr:unnamed protein product [Polarella glacialis]CAE8678905.1 unnamed protein product [Polarella glacialis]
MGSACSRAPEEDDAKEGLRSVSQKPQPVTLHIYDIGTSGGGQFLNSMLRPLDAGAFHCGVEVYGLEWSFSDIAPSVRTKEDPRSGIFSSWPRGCRGHNYCETADMGYTTKTEVEVLLLLSEMEDSWHVAKYDLFTRNCCHFCNDLCKALGLREVPPKLMKLAQLGSSIRVAGTASTACCSASVATCVVPCFPGARAEDAMQEVEEVNVKSDFGRLQKPLHLPVLAEPVLSNRSEQ